MTQTSIKLWGYTTTADKPRLDGLSSALFGLVCTQQMDRTCISWLPTVTMPSLDEYRRKNITYCGNCYPTPSTTNTDSTTEDTTTL